MPWKLIKCLVLLVFIGQMRNVYAQHRLDSIPEVLILDSIRSSKGAFRMTLDSLGYRPETKALSLAELLSSNSNLFFKSNGPGMLNTPTYRGGDASSTSVLWNGVKINSPMLGAIDFTEIQTGNFKEATLLTGTSSNLFASGGVGAAINLSQSPNFIKDEIGIRSQLGSFGNYYNRAMINQRVNIGGISLAIRVNANSILNNNEFSYIDNSTPLNKINLAKTSKFRQASALSSISAILSSKTSITLNSWNQRSGREVASPINVPMNTTRFQNDTASRLQLLLKHAPSKRMTLTQILFYERNSNHYIDSVADIDNNNQYYSLQSFTTVSYDLLKNQTINLQYLAQFTEASSMNYAGYQNEFRQEAKLDVDGSLKSNRLSYTVGSRFTYWKTIMYSMPFVSFVIPINKRVQVSSAISRTLRLPTLNEIYWNPGGNPGLKPEIGNTAEIGLQSNLKHLELNGALFYGNYQDQIRWLPEGAVFSPVNISNSQVYGVEFYLEKAKTIREVKLSVRPIVSYTRSLGQSTAQSEVYSLTFTPEILAQTWFSIKYKSLTCLYHVSYTDSRFISTDESAYMPAYTIQNLVLNWSKPNLPIALSARVNNLANTPYQNMPWFAMPGRNFSILLDYTWK